MGYLLVRCVITASLFAVILALLRILSNRSYMINCLSGAGREGPFVHIATVVASKLSKLPMFSHFRTSAPLMLQLYAAAA